MKAKGFSKALLYHLQWKVQLKKFLDGQGNFDVSAVSSDGCKFGKWLCSDEITKYASDRDIQDIEKVHTKLLKTAEQVYDLKMLGEDIAARREFKRMEAISMKLVSLLTTLKIINNN
jgi:hypothetical protein